MEPTELKIIIKKKSDISLSINTKYDLVLKSLGDISKIENIKFVYEDDIRCEKLYSQCKTCNTYKRLDLFYSNNKVYKTCSDCLEIVSSKKKYESRKQWKIDNYEKFIESTKLSEEKKRVNLDEYLEYKRELSKKYRETKKKISESDVSLKLKQNLKKEYVDCIKYSTQLGFKFEITEDECNDLFMDKCFICGVENNLDDVEELTLNLIERFDIKESFNPTNCYSVCKKCNKIKNTMDILTMFETIEHLLYHNGVITEGKLSNEKFRGYACSSYVSYSKGKELPFELTESEFKSLIKENCFICGRKNASRSYNGIALIKNEIGYTKDNCCSCCLTCNTMKDTEDIESFINHMFKIYENLKLKIAEIADLTRNEIRTDYRNDKESKIYMKIYKFCRDSFNDWKKSDEKYKKVHYEIKRKKDIREFSYESVLDYITEVFENELQKQLNDYVEKNKITQPVLLAKDYLECLIESE